jgi:hypothetical protein
MATFNSRTADIYFSNTASHSGLLVVLPATVALLLLPFLLVVMLTVVLYPQLG